MYPANWPRCPSCGDFALDGHVTCGRLECGEAAQRDATIIAEESDNGNYPDNEAD